MGRKKEKMPEILHYRNKLLRKTTKCKERKPISHLSVNKTKTKEVGAGSYQPRGMISKHRNPKKHVANIGCVS